MQLRRGKRRHDKGIATSGCLRGGGPHARSVIVPTFAIGPDPHRGSRRDAGPHRRCGSAARDRARCVRSKPVRHGSCLSLGPVAGPGRQHASLGTRRRRRHTPCPTAVIDPSQRDGMVNPDRGKPAGATRWAAPRIRPSFETCARGDAGTSGHVARRVHRNCMVRHL